MPMTMDGGSPEPPATSSASFERVGSTVTHRASRAAVSASASVPQRPRGKSRLPPKKSLASWNNLPPWLRDNEYIVNHYRVGWSWWDSLKSVFRLHNETGNIWTHLLGFLTFLALTLVTAYLRPAPFAVGRDLLLRLESGLMDLGRSGVHELQGLEARLVSYGATGLHEFQAAASQAVDLKRAMRSLGVESFAELEELLLRKGREGLGGLAAEVAAVEQKLANLEAKLTKYANTNWRALKAVAGAEGKVYPVNRWPIYVFTSGAMVCLLTSTICHVFGCCSKHVSLWIWRLDYAGISVLIVTSFYPPVYYAFMCDDMLRRFYLASTTVMGIATVFTSLMEVFQTPKYRPFRASMYAGLGMWGIVPLLHGAGLYRHIPQVVSALLLDILMGLVYLAGAAIYAMRVPERWWPGSFDLAFNSHQLFHVAVVAGALVHYKAALLFLDWRDAHACPATALATAAVAAATAG